ncbi:MAG: hypothetical protein U9R60_11135, partial [Bacteroidota bacterium]|nr:hypothetical protein [Bacteroidota bacterium]
MSSRSFILSLFLLLLVWGCSNTRFLTEDQLLYTGREKAEIIFEQPETKSAEVKNYVNSVTSHKVNNALFGRRILPPIGLWTQNYWKVDEKRKFIGWVHKTLASDQILVSDVNPELRAKNIESELFDQGYFQTKAWSVIDTSSRNPKKARIKYFVEVAPPYHYDQIAFDTLRLSMDTLMSQIKYTKHLKTGDQFNLEHLISARNELSRGVQNKGYFYYTPDFVELQADTSGDDFKVDLLISRQEGLSPSQLAIYGINDIVIYLSRPSDRDSLETDTIHYDGITIVSRGDLLKPDVLRRSVFFNRGDTYSYTAYQKSISRLNNLGIFNYARISYVHSEADSLSDLLDVRIDLILSENINVDFEADVVTKSSGYAGPQLSVGVAHGNAFKGAEKVHVQLKGGLEWQWGNKTGSELGTLSYEFGIGGGLTFPKIILPGNQNKSRHFRIHETSVNIDLDFINRTAYYRMSSHKEELNYKWGKSQNIHHSFSPIYLNSVNLLETTPEFDSVVDENIYIRKSFEEQFIFGMNY